MLARYAIIAMVIGALFYTWYLRHDLAALFFGAGLVLAIKHLIKEASNGKDRSEDRTDNL